MRRLTVNTSVMKKTLFFCVATLVIVVLSTLLLSACDSFPSQREIANECIRIHIRANSNSEQDQSVKLKVRDEITAYLTEKLAGCKSKPDAENKLRTERQNLVNIANHTLYANKFDYKASIALKQEHFPDRKYGDYDFPEGDYEALIIYLGEGVGDNWWCVAFPPLCFVPESGNGEKIVYKSWVKEWLDKLFSK